MITKTKPQFSVVIPLYNKRAHIERTIESVLAQTFDCFEIVIVDDGSTDGGADFVNTRFEGPVLDSNKLRLIRQQNAGVSVARNNGVYASEGEIIAFLDADDTWEPHFLEEIASLSETFQEAGVYATSYQFIVGENHFVDPKIRFSKPISEARILDDYFEVGARGALPFMMSSFCIRKDVFDKLGGFPVGKAMGEDQDLFCRAAVHSKIAYSPSVLSFYHHDAENRACELIVPSEECCFAERLREYAKNEIPESTRYQLINYIASHLLHLASLNVKAGNLHVARKLLSKSECKLQYMRYIWWRFRCEFALTRA